MDGPEPLLLPADMTHFMKEPSQIDELEVIGSSTTPPVVLTHSTWQPPDTEQARHDEVSVEIELP